MQSLLAIEIGPYHVSPIGGVMFVVYALLCLCLLGIGIIAIGVAIRYYRTGKF
jgi:hypothetical protein